MWNIERLENIVSSAIEENKHLEFKGAKALTKQESVKKEISKDIASFANSDGGTIIYGIKEYDDVNKKHLPEKIDPIDRLEYTKEWLENIITGNISPRINDLTIHPVIIDDSQNHIAYVIEIPKSNTAHQSADNRYYKRFNFKAMPMDDWEVKDVINRIQTPAIRITLYPTKYQEFKYDPPIDKYEIVVVLKNEGAIAAQYVEFFAEFSINLKPLIRSPRPLSFFPDKIQIPFSNKIENKIKIEGEERTISVHYQPYLPDIWREIGTIQVRKEFFDIEESFKCHVSTEYGKMDMAFSIAELKQKLGI